MAGLSSNQYRLFNGNGRTAMRMVLEVVMLLALLGGLFFAMKVLAKENKLEKTLSEKHEDNT